MRRFPLLAVLLLAGCWSAPHGPAPAALVLTHGQIRTEAQGRPRVEALAIADGRILYAGTDADARRYVGPETRVVDLGGRLVLPGFIDAHVHLLKGGLERQECLLTDLGTKEAILARIATFARSRPQAAWIRGRGWELPTFPQGNPRKEWLDEVVPDRPAFFQAADGHSAWVNSRALALANVRRGTPDPAGGRIERDPTTGEPTGTLREAAQNLVIRLLPPRSAQDRAAALADAMHEANRLGITATFEANVDEPTLRAYSAAANSGKLTVRVVAAHQTDPLEGAAQVPRLIALRAAFGARDFEPRAAKIIVDGVIEARTAAMLAPYLDPTTHQPTKDRGNALWTESALKQTVTALDRAGFQVHFHAMGDRAVRMALDGVAAARNTNGARDARHTIAHMETVDPADVPRFKALGVVAAFQPFWSVRDSYVTDLTEPVLGPERSARLYPTGDLARAGTALAFGSDWPVTSLSPLEGMQVAVTRRELEAPAGPAWLPTQLVDLETAVAGYTRGAAFASHREASLGSLEAGKLADLVVLDRDIFAGPPQAVHLAHPLLTLVGGKAVWREPEAREYEGL